MQAIYYDFRKQLFNIKIKTEILERKEGVSTVEIKYISHTYNVQESSKSNTKDDQCFQDWLDVVLNDFKL